MKQYEYKVQYGLYDNELNELGTQGWELVSVVYNMSDGTRYFFKREI